jgi:Leucine-rich repeat (LRR) protein
MKKIAILLSFFFLQHTYAQKEFDKYGPMGCGVQTDLKQALKVKDKEKVYKLDLNYVALEPKLYHKISTLKDLMALRLRGNSVNVYPDNMHELNYLVYFASYNNAMTSFPKPLKSFYNLEYLELQHTKIDSIPAEIVYLQKLKTLKFGNTDDTLALPVTLKFMKNLKEVSFENVILDSLPKEILKVKTLTFLYLSNTNTHYLSRHCERLSNLEVLILENNPIAKLPNEIYMAHKLRFLSLRNNKLTKLPETISALTELALLDLRGNPMEPEEIEKIKALLPGCEVKF